MTQIDTETQNPFEISTDPFDALIGEEFFELLLNTAPTKVRSRVLKALDHYHKAKKLKGVDEEMGAIRLIAGEEELVVAIFEWIKLNEKDYPEHRDFVRKFKNHTVKLAFYPVLAQIRFVMGDMLTDGIVMEGLEEISWSLKPVIEDKAFRLAIVGPKGDEVWRHDPLHHDISREGENGMDVVPHLLAELEKVLEDQRKQTLRQFLSDRTEYRNHLLYASDAGHLQMDDALDEIFEHINITYRDLLWVLLALISGKPISKQYGIVTQFMGVYRAVLTKAGIIKTDGGVAELDAANVSATDESPTVQLAT